MTRHATKPACLRYTDKIPLCLEIARGKYVRCINMREQHVVKDTFSCLGCVHGNAVLPPHAVRVSIVCFVPPSCFRLKVSRGFGEGRGGLEERRVKAISALLKEALHGLSYFATKIHVLKVQSNKVVETLRCLWVKRTTFPPHLSFSGETC